MSVYQILTETGSFYALDTDDQTLERRPASNGEKLAKDNEVIHYETLLSELTIDTPLRVLWHLDGKPKVRTTSLMVEIARV